MFPQKKEQFYQFDGFVVDAVRRLLLRDNQPLQLNPKAFDLLVTLIENRGQVMRKEQLLELVWPDQFVEEGNLTVHISAVRKALGERKEEHRYIVTLPGRGYQFVADLVESEEAFVFEQHTLSRITVEEEQDSDDFLDAANTTPSIADEAVAPGKEPLRQPEVEISAWATPQQPITTATRRLPNTIIAAAVLLGLLIISFFGFRLYREKQKPGTGGNLANAQGMTSKQLTAIGNVRFASLSPDGKYFVYVSVQRGLQSMWLGHVNGGSPVQVRPPENVNYGGVTFAPDGGTIFYELDGSLFQMPVLGSAAQKVLDHIPVRYSVAPDGKHVAFVRDDPDRQVSSLIIDDFNGSSERELVTLPGGREFSNYGPAWSPDGTKLAIGARSQTNPNQSVLMGVQVADGKMQELSPRTWDIIGKVAWLHDGSGVVFNSVGAESDFHIWLLDYPQGNLRRVTNDLARYGRDSVSLSDDGSCLLLVRGETTTSIWVGPAADVKQQHKVTSTSMGKIDGSAGLAWTPDGKIVYTSLLNNSISLWLMNSDGSAANQVTSSGFYDKFPKMPKDSRHIVFQSNRSGGSEIWRVNADGSDLRQLTQGGRNSTPDVTPDGSWVLYAVNERGASTIWRISIDGGTPVRLTNAQSSWPQVSPDGKYFACAYADRTLSPATQLAVFPLAGGQPFTHFAVQGGAELSNGIHWSPDNGSLIYRDLGAGLWRQSLAGGAPQKLPDLPDRKIWFCDWSMDGKQFALAYGEEMRDVVLLANFR